MGARRTVTFLLDANVRLDFQNASLLHALVQAAQVVDMAVAEKVFDEVTLPKVDDSSDLVGKKRPAAIALRGSRIATIEILPGTAEAALIQAPPGAAPDDQRERPRRGCVDRDRSQRRQPPVRYR